jgi:hypothetical protein
LLRLWEQDLGDRPLSMRRGPEGKRASATFVQTEQYIEPLLKQLKKRVSGQPHFLVVNGGILIMVVFCR